MEVMTVITSNITKKERYKNLKREKSTFQSMNEHVQHDTDVVITREHLIQFESTRMVNFASAQRGLGNWILTTPGLSRGGLKVFK